MTPADLADLIERVAKLERIVALLLRLQEPELTGEQRQAAERELAELSGE
jgi:hypothetical protein